MKAFFALILTLSGTLILNAQGLNLPFLDNFENDIDGWTTQNTISGAQWYWNNEEGYEGSNSVSFTLNLMKPYDDNDAWLVTPNINTDTISHVKINFKYMRWGDYLSPRLYYTYNFTGDVTTTEWTEIEGLNWVDDRLQYYDIPRLEIETPEDNFWFAFRYQTTADTAAAFYIDNFKIESYTPPSPFVKVDSTEHFAFFTNINSEKDFHLNIKDELEKQFDKLSSLWNRPGIDDIFIDSDKVKVYFSVKTDINLVTEETPSWKSGFYDTKSQSLFLSPLILPNQADFYGTFCNLAINTFSQLAIVKKFERENNTYLPSYFLEGFGMYEMGIRPRRDSVVNYLNNNATPDFDFLTDTSGISNTLKKDMILTNIEGQLLTTWSYLAVGPGAYSYISFQWPNYLKYFYGQSETSRIKLMLETEHFDFYWAENDTAHSYEIERYFEDEYTFYVENYKFLPKHKFNVVIIPTEAIGMSLTGYDDFNGGAGCGGDLVIDLSPNYNYNAKNYYSKYFGYEGLCAHEFFHVFYNHFMWQIPGGFWAEGTADFSQRHSLNWAIPEHSLWKIEELFTTYKKNHNATINLKHIADNPYGEIDIYFLGDMFFEFLYQKHGGYENIRKFFNQGMDYSVFEATYEEIDNGYIKFLKSLVGITDVEELNKFPVKIFIENNQLVIQNSNQIQDNRIELFNITGQKLLERNISVNQNEKWVLPLPFNGKSKIYIVRLYSGKSTIVKKLYNPEL